MIWVRPIQRAIMGVPVLGPALQTLALARLAWSMQLTMNAGMELRRALRLSLKSTGNARFIGATEPIDRAIAAGESIYEAFCRARIFPNDFLDTLQVGEESGSIVESMAHLSRQYREQSRVALGRIDHVCRHCDLGDGCGGDYRSDLPPVFLLSWSAQRGPEWVALIFCRPKALFKEPFIQLGVGVALGSAVQGLFA